MPGGAIPGPCRRFKAGKSHEAASAARAEQETGTRQARYALRAGIEGAIDQALDVTGIRRARYRRLPKVRLQHAFSAAALNVIRLDAYWSDQPLGRTRISRLDQLAHTLTV
ncbi:MULTISPECIES: transposase [Streptomyces]|uniref:transposase n=1 Tax=Streptomyces TaxID=1883 RepID=UPI00133115E6|nr:MULTISPECIES: transposase [Streptomyces]